MSLLNRPTVKLIHLGRMRYLPALKFQESMVNRLQAGEDNHFLILVEHDPVYTIGIRRNEYGPDVVESLRKLGADFVTTNRGGLITFHGPGQLVAYPILNLNKLVGKRCQFKNQREKCLVGMRWYVHTLEQTVIDCLSNGFGLSAIRSPHTGVWVGDNKICAMGVHNSNLITSHGLALNCNIDLTWFQHITPCGIRDKGVTSLSQELKENIEVKFAQKTLVEHFERNFECDVKQ